MSSVESLSVAINPGHKKEEERCPFKSDEPINN